MTLEPTSSRIPSPGEGPLHRNTHTYDLIQQCIHCGFCLPTCPTYVVLGVEMDSPRGRIYQMKAVADGTLAVTDDFVEHMNCCLGCRACETACPSGVQYGKLIEAAREQIQLSHATITDEKETSSYAADKDSTELEPQPQPALNRVTLAALRRFFFDIMLPSRLVLTLIFAGLKLYQRSGLQAFVHRTGLFNLINALPTPFQGRLKIPESLMDAAMGPILPQPLPEVTPALGLPRYRVGFISGCIMDQVFRDVNEATLRVLAANGCEVITPMQQGCCGALHVHGGEAAEGRALARQNIDVFEQYQLDAIIINAAGCGSTLKEYHHLLRDDHAYAARAEAFSNKVKDISEFLASIELNPNMDTLPYTATYHDACHLAHGQKIRQQPRQLLKSIPGLTLLDLKESDFCCGSAGIYNIVNQEMGKTLLERKINNIIETNATVIVSSNPGCTMQIAMGVRERGLPMVVKHPVQLLDEAYHRAGCYDVPSQVPTTQLRPQRTLLLGLGITALLALFLLRRRRIR